MLFFIFFLVMYTNKQHEMVQTMLCNPVFSQGNIWRIKYMCGSATISGDGGLVVTLKLVHTKNHF